MDAARRRAAAKTARLRWNLPETNANAATLGEETQQVRLSCFSALVVKRQDWISQIGSRLGESSGVENESPAALLQLYYSLACQLLQFSFTVDV